MGKENRDPLYDARTSILETLPAEIKLIILSELPNDATLRKLISAYPVFRQIKRDNHERITTAMTINHITDLGCNPFDHHDIVEIKLPGGKRMDQAFMAAFKAFYDTCRQHKANGSTRTRLIPFDLCKQMLKVVHASGWIFTELEVGWSDPIAKYDEDGNQVEFQRPLVGKLHHQHHKASVGFIVLGRWTRYQRELHDAIKFELQMAAWEHEIEERKEFEEDSEDSD